MKLISDNIEEAYQEIIDTIVHFSDGEVQMSIVGWKNYRCAIVCSIAYFNEKFGHNDRFEEFRSRLEKEVDPLIRQVANHYGIDLSSELEDKIDKE